MRVSKKFVNQCCCYFELPIAAQIIGLISILFDVFIVAYFMSYESKEQPTYPMYYMPPPPPPSYYGSPYLLSKYFIRMDD